MSPSSRHASVIVKAAQLLVDAFDDYNASFADITRRARRRFERGERAGMRRDSVARLNLYDRSVDEAISRLEQHLDERLFSRTLWVDIRGHFETLIDGQLDAELYKTFFNTISRRLHKTRGVDPAIEFVALDIQPTDRITHPVSRHTYAVGGELERTFRRILADHDFRLPYRDADADSTALAEGLARVFATDPAPDVLAIELLETVFYREGRAYLLGRAFGAERYVPCVIALCRSNDGIYVDALLTTRQQLSILFGYTFSYFMADLPTVGDAVVFLRTLLPEKPIEELYTVLGRVKQGKTERYRAFVRQINAHPEEKLVEADGQKGLVMLVFTLPSYPLVFKLIRDHFAPVKKFGRRQVIERYHLVFRHDRVGRLIDAQQFKDLRFPREQFSPELLSELQAECGRSLQADGDGITIRHCYVERRLRPLDLYIAETDEPAAAAAVLDYAQAIKDLARSNIFAGDLLPKNFGVTRSGRVIFYDYDELRLMTECRFRRLPPSRDDIMELNDEPWFHVEDNDVFPEQFPRFMGLSRGHLALLQDHHPDLFDPAWWQAIHARLKAGEALDVPPYSAEARLHSTSKQP
ncbi:bifunctional isocitrate dehydrogenase kinase/phosphatase [Wenzhouxiangella limi]|uniref:Isocitrate dehydrogenase kinase/phosphatase n=1 Tax=Wenzhouxiangella limi TaxID=2707351 RepID=A0A845VG14_9GAMM|nr:bifunctional isocitrate dehydrogenase kinase/phosphatase [Wenzhouxiangella limi]NDY96159.1 bifunctional isocitrate dehydrogenase kinase/phosphatase [Wenzhouxiangella limi]